MGTGLNSEQLLLLEHGHHTRMLQTTQGLCPTSSSSTPSPPRSAWQSMQVLSRRNVCIGALDGSLLAALTGRAPSHQVAVLHNTSGTPHRQPTAERASAPGLRLRASTRTAAAPRAHGTASSPSTEPAVLGSRCACQDPGRSPTCCRGLGSFHTAEACWRHEGRRLPGRTVSPTPSASIKASRPSHAQRAAPPARHEGPLPAHGTAAARQLPRRKGRPAGTQPPRPAHGPAGGAIRLPAHPAGQDGARQARTRRPPRWAQPRSAATSRSAPRRPPAAARAPHPRTCPAAPRRRTAEPRPAASGRPCSPGRLLPAPQLQLPARPAPPRPAPRGWCCRGAPRAVADGVWACRPGAALSRGAVRAGGGSSQLPTRGPIAMCGDPTRCPRNARPRWPSIASKRNNTSPLPAARGGPCQCQWFYYKLLTEVLKGSRLQRVTVAAVSTDGPWALCCPWHTGPGLHFSFLSLVSTCAELPSPSLLSAPVPSLESTFYLFIFRLPLAPH